jgi:hypothetical protein
VKHPTSPERDIDAAVHIPEEPEYDNTRKSVSVSDWEAALGTSHGLSPISLRSWSMKDGTM